jgi:hypothetical protein
MVAGEAEEACIDAVNAFKSTASIQVWSSDSDVTARLIFGGHLDVEIMRFSGFRYFRQSPTQILHGIGFNAVKWADGDAMKKDHDFGALGLALFVAWTSICAHDMKPAIRGVPNYKAFLTALVTILIKEKAQITKVISN